MSYSFTVPRPEPGAVHDPNAHVTTEEFVGAAQDALEAALAYVTDEGQREASRTSALAAIEAAKVFVEQGRLGPTFIAHIAGHANPTPGAPEGGWSNDTVSISLSAVKVAESPAESPVD